MRILIASTGTVPGYSGGWTTTLDLLGDDHESMYVISDTKPGLHSMEGVKYLGLGLGHTDRKGSLLPHRLANLLRKSLAPFAVRWAYRKFKADFVMCLDETIGFSVQKTGLPYALRFHTKINPSLIGDPLEKLIGDALFSTACKGSDVPGVEMIPHNQDLSRFSFSPAAKPERALLLTSINEVHEPDLFIEGICLSKNMKGDIIGTGPSKNRIKKVCLSTVGRVRLLDPVARLQTGQLSGKYQVGVATIIRRDRIVYQMKVNMYLACGMHAIVKPYTHIAKEAPELVDTFSSPRELADRLDETAERWKELEPRRIRAREWILENYSVEIPRKRFREILRKTFSDYN
jgi:glycosyltransferase involved in cell wall biosynthesis